VAVLICILGRCCDENGNNLPPGAPPPPTDPKLDNNYFPYDSQGEFELADFLFRKEQMSGGKIDELMEIWVTLQQERYDDDEPPPFANAQELYNMIDGTMLGDVPWQAFSVEYNGNTPPDAPKWMSDSYEVWFRDPLDVMESQIGNRDFGPNEMDYMPKKIVSMTGKRQYSDLMLGDWAWDQAVCDVSNHNLLEC